MLGRYFTASSGSTRLLVCRAFDAVTLAVTGKVRRCMACTRTSPTRSALILIGVRVTAVSGFPGADCGGVPWARRLSACASAQAARISPVRPNRVLIDCSLVDLMRETHIDVWRSDPQARIGRRIATAPNA